MMEKSKSKYYVENHTIYVDHIPIGTKKNIESVKFLGLGEPKIFQYQNGKIEYRWRFVDVISPDAEPWFILRIIDNQRPEKGALKIAACVHEELLLLQWLTPTKMAPSKAKIDDLSILDVAMIEFEIDRNLGGINNCLDLNI